MLETGSRGLERRGLVEDVAHALGCAVVDLTGQPYLPGDRESAEALATLPPLSVALYDATLDDVPDMPARPSTSSCAGPAANEHTANNRYPAPVDIWPICLPNRMSMLSPARHDPVARELVHELDRRARMRAWELDSLKNRLGVEERSPGEPLGDHR